MPEDQHRDYGLPGFEGRDIDLRSRNELQVSQQAQATSVIVGEEDVICIRCEDEPAADRLGYCGHCHWAVKVEIAEGFYQLLDYLEGWWRFAEWCVEHEAAA